MLLNVRYDYGDADEELVVEVMSLEEYGCRSEHQRAELGWCWQKVREFLESSRKSWWPRSRWISILMFVFVLLSPYPSIVDFPFSFLIFLIIQCCMSLVSKFSSMPSKCASLMLCTTETLTPCPCLCEAVRMGGPQVKLMILRRLKRSVKTASRSAVSKCTGDDARGAPNGPGSHDTNVCHSRLLALLSV